ncbi:MAG: hypothetical protein ABIJ40_07915, partial [Bacteroidota bacterium]
NPRLKSWVNFDSVVILLTVYLLFEVDSFYQKKTADIMCSKLTEVDNLLLHFDLLVDSFNKIDLSLLTDKTKP